MYKWLLLPRGKSWIFGITPRATLFQLCTQRLQSGFAKKKIGAKGKPSENPVCNTFRFHRTQDVRPFSEPWDAIQWLVLEIGGLLFYYERDYYFGWLMNIISEYISISWILQSLTLTMFVVATSTFHADNPIGNLWSWYLLNFLYGICHANQFDSSPQDTSSKHHLKSSERNENFTQNPWVLAVLQKKYGTLDSKKNCLETLCVEICPFLVQLGVELNR